MNSRLFNRSNFIRSPQPIARYRIGRDQSAAYSDSTLAAACCNVRFCRALPAEPSYQAPAAGPDWIHEIKHDGLCMSPRSDMYRQRAADAKNRATQTNNPHVKSAFKEVARGWLLLAEQMEWMDRQEEAKEGDASPTPTSRGVQAFPTWSLITRHNFGMPEIGNPDRWLHSGTVFASGFPAYGSSGETATFLLTARGRRRAAAIGRGS
jgi:hypothetical protein